MKRVRWLPVLLLGILLITALAGCGGTPAPAAKPDAKAAVPAGAVPAPAPAAKTATPAPAPGPVKQLALGAVPSSSSHYAYHAAIAKSINAAVKGVQVSVVESGASVDNLNRIRSKQFDFGLANISTAFEAYSGILAWKEKKMPNLRFLWTYAVSPYLIVAREDSGVTKLQDFEGKGFSPGGTGSSTAVATERVIEALGIGAKIYRGSHEDGANALKNKQVAGFTKISSGIRSKDAMLMDIQATTKIRFLSFADADAKKVQAKYGMYSWVKVPAGIYEGQNYEVLTHGDLSGVVATVEMAPELVYELTKAVFADKKNQETAFGGLKEVDYVKDSLLNDPAIPLHAGVVKYLKEQGVNVPQKLIPPEYKG